LADVHLLTNIVGFPSFFSEAHDSAALRYNKQIPNVRNITTPIDIRLLVLQPSTCLTVMFMASRSIYV